MAELESFLAANSSFVDAAEAINALNLTLVEDVGYSGVAYAVQGGAGQVVIGQVGETALDVATQAALNGSTQTVTSSAIGALQTSGGAKAAAILGMDLGIIGAACAPILGVALGAELYNNNPSLWSKISQKLLPFCWPGTTQIPTWGEIVDDAWQISVAKEVIDVLKELFEDENIPIAGQTTKQATSDLDTGLTQPIPISNQVTSVANYVVNGGGVDTITMTGATFAKERYGEAQLFFVAASATAGAVVTIIRNTVPNIGTPSTSTRTLNVNGTYTYNGKTVYYTIASASTQGNNNNTVTTPEFAGGSASNKYGQIAWTIIYGNITGGGSYPVGTSEWEGNILSEIPQASPAIIGYDEGTSSFITQLMVPISPPMTIPTPSQPKYNEVTEIPFPWPEPETDPHTEPWPETMPWPLPDNQPDWWPSEIPYPYKYPTQNPSADPDEQPDPTTITNPSDQVQPYVMPFQYPWESDVQTIEVLPDADPTIPRKPTRVTTDYQDPSNPDIPPGSLINLFPAPNGISPSSALPDTPLAFSGNIGLVTVYHPTQSQLLTFESWLWVTYNNASIDKIWNNPFDGVISLFEIYCTPNDVGNRNIHCGFLDSGINSAIVSRYVEIDCGTIGIPEFYGNYFDYSPYTQAHIYLPFIGIQELNADDIVGHAVNVTYRIDTYNGSCIAMITVAKVTELGGETIEYSNLMYQFSGNCAVELPLSGGSQASIRAGMMQADAWQSANQVSYRANLVGGIASALMGALTGSPGFLAGAVSSYGNALSGKAAAQANYLQNMLSGKSTVQKSGSFGSSCGALGVKIPYITITRPKQIQVPNYNLLYGYPSHKMVYIGDCEGFLRCREVHVISPTATDEEKSMIENLLKTGVYVTE